LSPPTLGSSKQWGTMCPHSRRAPHPSPTSSFLPPAQPSKGSHDPAHCQLQATQRERKHSRARSIPTIFVSRVASDLAASTEEAREERIFLRLLLPASSAPRRRVVPVVVIAEFVRLDPTSAGCPTTVAAITVPSGFSLWVRDKREGLQEGAQRRRCRRSRSC
jgi:hypothetical protein